MSCLNSRYCLDRIFWANVNTNTTVGNANTANENTNISVVDPNLVAQWQFDEGSGTTISDSVENYQGTIHGATWEPGAAGYGLKFDGVDDYIELSAESLAAIGNLNEGTVAFWFKFDSLLDTQSIMPIFYLGMNSTSKPDNMFIIEIGHSDTQSYAYKTDPDNKKIYVTWIQNNQEPILCYDSTINLLEDTWYHFALVVDENGNTGYLNGVEMTNRYYNFGTASDQILFSEIPVQDIFTLGYGKTHHQISPDFVYFKGSLDDVRIYNRALTGAEMLEFALGR